MTNGNHSGNGPSGNKSGKLLLSEKRRSTYRSTPEGYVEEFDIETGELLKVHGSVRDISVMGDDYHEVSLGDGRKVLVSPSVNGDKYVRGNVVEFSWALVDLICQKVREGSNLTRVCGSEGFPSYATFCEWRRREPEIEEMLAQAREDRGEYFADELMSLRDYVPENKTDGDDKRTNVDILKWGAEKGNRQRYGNNTKVEVSGKVGHAVLVVETGVRKSLEGVVVDETAKIREAEKIVDEGGEDGT